MIESSFRNKKYNSADAIRILNPKQAAFYWGNGCEPVDIYISKNFDTGDPIIVYIFLRTETKDSGVYDSWCARSDKNVPR